MFHNHNRHRSFLRALTHLSAWMIGVVLMLILLLPHAAHAQTRPEALMASSLLAQQDGVTAHSPEQEAVAALIRDANTVQLSDAQIWLIVTTGYEQAKTIDVDPMVLFALMRLESRFNPHAKSSHGARGLMQVMPRVHRDKLHGRNPDDIVTSIVVGAQVFSDCLTRHQRTLQPALTCYAGGNGRHYNQLFVKFRQQVNHFVLALLFPPPDPSPPRQTVFDQQLVALPRYDEVYAFAQ